MSRIRTFRLMTTSHGPSFSLRLAATSHSRSFRFQVAAQSRAAKTHPTTAHPTMAHPTTAVQTASGRVLGARPVSCCEAFAVLRLFFTVLWGLGVLAWASPADAHDRWYLELREPAVDELSAQTSVSLELAELEIPGDPRREDDSKDEVSLYFRVERSDGRLLVSLWDRGQYIGRRIISDSGPPRILARRVGLAAGELAHDLRGRRQREAAQVERERAEAKRLAAVDQELARRRELGIVAGASSQLFIRGAWQAGPELGLSFNYYFPLRLSSHVRWSAGAIGASRDESTSRSALTWSSWDWDVGALWVGELNPRTHWNVGSELALGVVHVGGSASVDGLAQQRDTWSARVGLLTELERKVGSLLWVALRLRAGSALRRIPIVYGEQSLGLGGLYLGASLRVTLTPG